jgi:hypothetical protein
MQIMKVHEHACHKNYTVLFMGYGDGLMKYTIVNPSYYYQSFVCSTKTKPIMQIVEITIQFVMLGFSIQIPSFNFNSRRFETEITNISGCFWLTV